MNNVRRTTKPLEAKNHRLNSIEKSLVASQVSEIAKDKVDRKSTSTRRQRNKPAPPAKQLTMIEAKIDVGFGNSLFIRGQGAELSWDKGLPLNCTDRSTWSWSTAQAKDKVLFKLLLNDQVWAKGEDVVVEAGGKIELTPAF